MTDTYVNFNAQLRPDMVAALDREAREIGISRMSLIKVILHEHLKEQAQSKELFSTHEVAPFLYDEGEAAQPYRPRSGFAP